MNTAQITPGVAVLLFGDQPVPGPLAGLPAHRVESRADLDALDDAMDAVIGQYRRVVVVGADPDLAIVLTRLLRADRLDVEVAYAPPRRSAATRVYRLPAGRRAARRARGGAARRVTLIRDETGTVIVGRARWIPTGGASNGQLVHGEAVVDDTQLFDGDVAGVCIEPTPAPPGLRAALKNTGRWRRWISGRAAQLGTTGATVVRDGVAAPRTVRRSTFYRHVEGWLLVR